MFVVQEGAEFLKRSGAEDLVAKPDADTEKPAVQRDTTIEATVKEAETFLEGQQVDGSTRAQTAAIEEAKAESEPPKLPQDNTMVQTAKVGVFFFFQATFEVYWVKQNITNSQIY